jgi:hypothetical protein
LQELIAPWEIRFFNSSWLPLGKRSKLANLLCKTTSIGIKVLQDEPLSELSMAKRMSSASQRTTTRPEDAAYHLFGLFDVNTPPLYREGKEAVRRLQEGIIK